MGESNCTLTILDVANVLQNNFAFVSGESQETNVSIYKCWLLVQHYSFICLLVEGPPHC